MNKNSSWEFEGHCLLRNKNQGVTKVLRDDVIVIVFYINDTESCWTDADIAQYRAEHDIAMKRLMADASKRGVPLKIRTASCQLNVPCVCGNESCDWIKTAISLYRKGSAGEYQEYYEEKYDCDEAPIIFALNKNLRSFASTAEERYPTWDEYSVVGRDYCGFTSFTIEHELLHQFGAVDLYYPKEVIEIAKLFLPQSIMNDGYEIDPLTEYLIGWKENLGYNAALFLARTQHFTVEDIYQAISDEWKK